MSFKEWCIVDEHGNYMQDVSIGTPNEFYMFTKSFEYRKRYFSEDELDKAKLHAEFCYGTIKEVNTEVSDYVETNEIDEP